MSREKFLQVARQLAILHRGVDNQHVVNRVSEHRIEVRQIRRAIEGMGYPEHETQVGEQVMRKECCYMHDEVS